MTFDSSAIIGQLQDLEQQIAAAALGIRIAIEPDQSLRIRTHRLHELTGEGHL